MVAQDLEQLDGGRGNRIHIIAGIASDMERGIDADGPQPLHFGVMGLLNDAERGVVRDRVVLGAERKWKGKTAGGESEEGVMDALLATFIVNIYLRLVGMYEAHHPASRRPRGLVVQEDVDLSMFVET